MVLYLGISFQKIRFKMISSKPVWIGVEEADLVFCPYSATNTAPGSGSGAPGGKVSLAFWVFRLFACFSSTDNIRRCWEHSLQFRRQAQHPSCSVELSAGFRASSDTFPPTVTRVPWRSCCQSPQSPTPALTAAPGAPGPA